MDLNSNISIKQNILRCFECNKKITLTYIQCKCKNYYCKKHYLAEKHNCQFDYFKYNQNEIIKNNPLIQNKKYNINNI